MADDQLEIRIESFDKNQQAPEDGYLVSIHVANMQPNFWATQDLNEANKIVTQLKETCSHLTVTINGPGN